MLLIEKAKEKDNGFFAKIGMQKTLADIWGVNINSECVEYTVDTFLECVDTMTFEEYIETVEIYEEEDVKDLSNFGSLNNIVDGLMYIYGIEIFVDSENNLLYTTEKEYTDKMNNRRKLNYIGIVMELERLCILSEEERVTENDIEVFIEILSEYGFDIEETYDYKETTVQDTAITIIDRMNQIFSLW